MGGKPRETYSVYVGRGAMDLSDTVCMTEEWMKIGGMVHVVRWLTGRDGSVLYWGSETMPEENAPFTIFRDWRRRETYMRGKP